MSLPFKLTPDVLIPRPETETLVEAVVQHFKSRGKIRILDIGTGSGCIAVSLAKILPESDVVAVDNSPSALTLASENAVRNDTSERIRFQAADILDNGFEKIAKSLFNVIVSNPPYVSSKEWEVLPKEIRDYEPRQALCDEEDGLSFYRLIARKTKKMLDREGFLFVEAGDTQSRDVCKIFKESGFQEITFIKDLNGIERVVSAKNSVYRREE